VSANLLVELFTEELPPKALQRLGQAFAEGIAAGLAARGLLAKGHKWTAFATPRRLAVHLTAVLEKSLDREETKKMMPAKVGLDAAGKPTAALLKRLEKEGVAAASARFERKSEEDGEYVVLHRTVPGVALAAALQAALGEAIAKLPIPKVMSYQLADGATTVFFVRPAHALVALHGAAVVAVSVLGLAAGRTTHGHRFLGVKDIEIGTADAYEEALAAHGKVIASFDARRAATERQLRAKAKQLGASLGAEEDIATLLDEVTALVEQPAVYSGEFEREYLSVPQECLILTMRANQKYFPLFDTAGKLTNQFLIVSNMQLQNPRNIVEGNQRVVRPRLADARFFFETDRKTRLADRVPQLASVTYHNQLGSQAERVGRVRSLARAVAPRVGADPALADRAALLAKADLVTGMVGEFPELQGIMGRYYALADGEDPGVADAIEQHYRPRFAGDLLPENAIAIATALADKLQTLVDMFGIGQKPTGDKDPFALRRHALGVIRIMMETPHSLDLFELLHLAARDSGSAATTVQDLAAFIYDRLRGHLRDKGYSANEVEAVLALNPGRINRVVARIEALRTFATLPEAESLASANKRIGNILKKADCSHSPAESALFVEPAEKALARIVKQIGPDAAKRFAANDYAGTLKLLAQIKEPVDTFFNDVMVMAEDPKLRANRIALLRELHSLMNQVADISRLAT